MTLYTRQGDTGTTQDASGDVLPKSNLRIHAVGSVDELDALLGVLRTEEGCTEELSETLLTIQKTLYRMKADLATPERKIATAERVTDGDVSALEQWIDQAEQKAEPLTHFIIPGGTPLAAKLHFARTVCRRAERWVVMLSRTERINFACLRYVNRLSDWLFAEARLMNERAGSCELRAESSL